MQDRIDRINLNHITKTTKLNVTSVVHW